MSEVLYPISKKSMRGYAEDVLIPIARNECVTINWVPLAGRRRHSKFLIDNIEEYADLLPDHQYVFSYIDLLNLTDETSNGYLDLILRSLISQMQNKSGLENLAKKYEQIINSKASWEYTFLLKILRDLCKELSEKKYKTCLFLAEIDDLEWLEPYVFGNLRSLWEELFPNLQYVFLTQYDLRSDVATSKWNHLHQLVIQNIVDIPLLNSDDVEYMIWRFSKEFDYKFSDLEAELIREYGGTHPYLLKTSAKVIKEYSAKKTKMALRLVLSHNYPLQSISAGVARIVSEENMVVLKKIEKGMKLSSSDVRSIQNLIDRRMVIVSNNHYRLFSKSFEIHIRAVTVNTTELKAVTLQIDNVTNQLFCDGKSVEERFTNQEYSVIKLLIDNYDRIVSRDQIGEVMWANMVNDKYSDWAIDQLISKVRRKLTSIGVRNKLITIRGKGYKLKH